MAICEHNPKHARGECPNMTRQQFHDFAATPTKNLPARAKPKKLSGRAKGGKFA